jgi:hypothetical protein
MKEMILGAPGFVLGCLLFAVFLTAKVQADTITLTSGERFAAQRYEVGPCSVDFDGHHFDRERVRAIERDAAASPVFSDFSGPGDQVMLRNRRKLTGPVAFANKAKVQLEAKAVPMVEVTAIQIGPGAIGDWCVAKTSAGGLLPCSRR